jgi:hypothetical protein
VLVESLQHFDSQRWRADMAGSTTSRQQAAMSRRSEAAMSRRQTSATKVELFVHNPRSPGRFLGWPLSSAAKARRQTTVARA